MNHFLNKILGIVLKVMRKNYKINNVIVEVDAPMLDKTN